jgi:ADP-heptose:LPS heptosyltransferase
VVRHSGLGDLLTALPAMRAIRRKYPRHHLVTTCPESLLSLARRLAIADEFITEPPISRRDPTQHNVADDGIVEQILALRLKPQIVVALRVPVHVNLTRALVCIPQADLIAYRHPGITGTEGFAKFSYADHILTRWDRLLHPRGILTDRNDLYVAANAVPSGRWPEGTTVVHVGSASPARHWPTERWASVAAGLTALGHTVLLTGSEAERPLADEVAQSVGLSRDQNLCGATNILELASIVRSARLVLSTDTGVTHMATAFNRCSITLFGAVSPAQWGPPPEYKRNISLWKGGYGEPYAESADAGLLEISVADVLGAIKQFETLGNLQCVRHDTKAHQNYG